MAEYDPPREIVPIFNPVDWIFGGEEALTVAEGDGRYLKLTGGIEKGPVTFNQDITIKQDINFTDGINTASLGIDGGGDLAFQATGSVNMNGLTIDMTSGEIHKVPLIHGPNNVDLVVEGKGTGDVVLKTNNLNRVVVQDNGNIAMDTNVLFVDGVNNRVGVNTASPNKAFTVNGESSFTNTIYLNDQELRVRQPDDGNHFVGFKQNFGGVGIDGPMMVGFSAGGFGVKSGGDAVIARYDANNFYVNRTLTQSGSGTTSISNTSNATEVVPLSVSTPNLGTGRSSTWRFGVNTSAAYNQAQLSHFYSGSGSSNNRIDFGFFGIGARMSLRGDGNLGIGTTSPAQTLDVSGNIGLTTTGVVHTSQTSNQHLGFTNTQSTGNNNSLFGCFRRTSGGWQTVSNGALFFDIGFSGGGNNLFVPSSIDNCGGVLNIYLKKTGSGQTFGVFQLLITKIGGVALKDAYTVVSSRTPSFSATPTISGGTGDVIRINFVAGDTTSPAVMSVAWTFEGAV